MKIDKSIARTCLENYLDLICDSYSIKSITKKDNISIFIIETYMPGFKSTDKYIVKEYVENDAKKISILDAYGSIQEVYNMSQE